jgi:hypothetical protein
MSICLGFRPIAARPFSTKPRHCAVLAAFLRSRQAASRPDLAEPPSIEWAKMVDCSRAAFGNAPSASRHSATAFCISQAIGFTGRGRCCEREPFCNNRGRNPTIGYLPLAVRTHSGGPCRGRHIERAQLYGNGSRPFRSALHPKQEGGGESRSDGEVERAGFRHHYFLVMRGFRAKFQRRCRTVRSPLVSAT